ncbi:hypothetical protein FNF27_04338 [Cafeteria roenbergensis]|uniref:Major facilitator superfamily (MFS) profile domain-containing protein n=2 Tax=Cafeteria roenbergensis TaxID=33653 RepID=A0A5A8CZ62_CAFRO|nr:hypothetical protein FNF31_05712 [Cafeteria roenbergensis]KAA0174117.1 hypothetical protein FNF27_04338 [Cafeteria roenbergensis]
MNKWATLAMLFAAYATYYVTKKNYPYILAALSSSTTQGMAEGELFEAHSVAAMGSVHEAMCAVSKVAGGVFVDALPAPAVLAGSLAITAAANAVVATTSSLSVMVVSWGVNGFFQAFGWAAVGSIFFEWFPDPSQRGALYSVLSTSQNAGAAVAAVIVPLAMEATGSWRAAAAVPAVAGLGVATVTWLFVVASPGSGAGTTCPAGPYPRGDSAPAGGGWRAVRSVVGDWRQWALGVAYLLLSVVRSGSADWAVAMLGHPSGGSLPASDVGIALAAMELGGFVGGIGGGLFSDRVFRGRRAPVMLMAALVGALVAPWALGGGAALSGALLEWGAPAALVSKSTMTAAVFFLLGVVTFTPHVLLGLAAREMAGKGAISTAGGFVKGLGQVGSALAGTPLSHLQASFGWNAVALSWGACMALAAACFAPVALFERASPATPSPKLAASVKGMKTD